MSEDLLATVITLAIIAAMFAWVPLLKFICPPCSRFLESRRRLLPVGRRTSFPPKKRVA